MSVLTVTGRGRLSTMLAVLAAAFALLLVGGGTAFAAGCGAPNSLPGSCFSAGDGDQLDGPPDLVDWHSTGGAPMPDPAKGVDTKFSGGSKELNPGGWDFILGNNTPKADLLEGWSNLEAGRFLDVAFTRAKQTGDTYLAFELNQAPAGPALSTAGIPLPNRTTDDVLITYDIGTTGEPALIGMCTWEATGPGTGNWLRLDGVAVGGKIKRCTHLDATTTPAAMGTVNWGHSIANYLPNPDGTVDPATINAGQFGEAAVDLSSVVGRFITNPCGPNGWLWMHSRSSDSVTSQPKDLIGGGPITDPSCDLTIDKKVARGGDAFVDAGTANPLAAEVGDTLRYSITVTNPGTADLSVNVTDALCDPNTLTGPGGRDGTGDPLAGGQSVTYTCTHVVTQADYDADPTNHLLVNTACTTGTATLGSGSTTLGIDPKKCDDAVAQLFTAGTLPPATPIQVVSPTEVAPGQIVLGARITPGRARLLGPTGCQSRAFRARIVGTKIARVVFYLDGKRVKTLTRANFGKTFALRINPRHLRVGVHRLRVKVTFQRGSGTKAKTFRLSFQRCPRALRAPRFTG